MNEIKRFEQLTVICGKDEIPRVITNYHNKGYKVVAMREFMLSLGVLEFEILFEKQEGFFVF